MSFSLALQKLYPSADPASDFKADEGGIIHWNEARLGPRPDRAEIDAARLPALRDARKREMGERARADFAAAYPNGGSVERDMMKRKFPVNPRTNRDVEIQDRLLASLQAIDAAGTALGLTLEQAEAQIRAVAW